VRVVANVALVAAGLVAATAVLAGAWVADPARPPLVGSGTNASAAGVSADPLSSAAWSLSALHLPEAWRLVAGHGAPIVVAVVDTGVDRQQPDLRGAVLQWYDGSGTSDGGDVNGHGTLTAGVIAARANNHIGTAGACPWCLLLPVKVLGPDGKGETSVIAAGIRWAADQGARVINMSFVLDARDQEVTDAVLYAHARGAVLVAAAGNTGGSVPSYPASDPFVIGVAAAQRDGSLYPWSDRGSWVEISAPGCSPSTAPGSTYRTYCGTSSATAAAAGVIALALSAVPGATNVEIERALRRSVTPRAGADVSLGSLNALALVEAISSSLRVR
jgi:thermitase